ncbi:MAG: cation-transporting P-type ATPase [archaeon]
MSIHASCSIDDVFQILQTSPKGLNEDEAKKRQEKYGKNIIIQTKGRHAIWRFLRHFTDLFVILLFFASILSFISNMPSLSLTILIVVLVNATLGYVQEWRAEKAMETLRHWIPQYSKVVRSGELQKIPVEEIVPGDIIVLEEGDRVPADARLFEAFELWTNNVPLTGESEPQPRSIETLDDPVQGEFDAPNLVFMSTSVARGLGKAVVTTTGMNTRFGVIAGLTQKIQASASPLEKEIAYVAKVVFIAAIGVGILFFALASIFMQLAPYEAVLFMIGVMVSCVPEGLQVTLSTSLALSVLKMAKQNVLVKRLSSIQTLGSTTVICTDKTGTITKGEMTVNKIWIPDFTVEVSGVGYEPVGEFTSHGELLSREEDARLNTLVEAGALCNNSNLTPPLSEREPWKAIGDPTDAALLTLALKRDMNIEQILSKKKRLSLLPFDSKRKRMTSIHINNDHAVAYVKGAPRAIVSVSSQIETSNSVVALSSEWLASVNDKIRELGDQGLRLIAIAYRRVEMTREFDSEEVEKDLIFLGLVGIQDPARPEVREAVQKARRAGIRIKMLTGDYGPTAKSVALQVGIVESEDCSLVRGVDMEKIDDCQLQGLLKKDDVIFTRVAPEQKLRIVRLLRSSGEIVAVTGDGANDAPSLKEADIGVAMGVSGTDVAKESSDMVLLDDSFASIVMAVESGRAIFDNIRRFIAYVFAHNWAELSAYVLHILFSVPLPLLPLQVLAIDLGTDILPSLALGLEPTEPGTMTRPPRSRTERLFNRSTLLKSLYLGGFVSLVALVACFRTWLVGGWVWGVQLAASDPLYVKGTTMTFAGIAVAQVGCVLILRAGRSSTSGTGLSRMKWILLGIAGQLLATIAIVHVPFLQVAFGTSSLALSDWAFLFLFPVLLVSIIEVRKRYRSSRHSSV